MSSEAFFLSKTEYFKVSVDRLRKLENRLSVYRLISFLLVFILFFLTWRYSVTIAAFLALIFTGLFFFLIKYHSKIEKKRILDEHLQNLNQKELNCINGDLSGFADGREYINRDHSYSFDLDIFGNASLFQLINRTSSKPASDLLADWLKHPADIREINLRQNAVAELKPLIDWRQNLVALGYLNEDSGNNPAPLIHWTSGKFLFSQPSRIRIVSYGLSIVSLISGMAILFGLPPAVLFFFLSINFVVYYLQSRKISTLHEQVGKSARMLNAYSVGIEMIEKEAFTCEKLKTLQAFFLGESPASQTIRHLSKLVVKLDARYNIMVAIPLNLFFFWDIHYCLALEKWKKTYASRITSWFDAMAEFEVLSSLANLAYKNPSWVFPAIETDYFKLYAENCGHPLIREKSRITNTLEISGTGKVILVTGSNMSGKSTFLRTCGVNAVLAQAGSVVCASSFSMSHIHIFSSMRISDSLEDNTSSFYAELKKLAAIIKEAESNSRVFLLLDEILRGTNSNDRFIGSVALINQLIDYGTVAVVATHDLKLAELERQIPGKIDNYHFDVKIEGEELFFDYKLNPGICTSMNASLLMKKMGIRM